MSKPQPFVVPAGVTFQITDAGVVIENEGDIVLHTNFGRSLTRIVSIAGSITVHAPVEGGTLHAAQDVSVHGDVRVTDINAGGSVSVGGNADVNNIHARGNVSISGDARASTFEAGGAVQIGGAAATGPLNAGGNVSIGGDSQTGAIRSGGTIELGGAVKADGLHGVVIRITGGSVAVRGIQAGAAVHVGAAKVQVDAIIAPEVHLDPKTSGRVTVIECQNEVGPNAVKGGFRLADYAETFGDPGPFLAERSLVPLGEPVPVPAVVTVPAVSALVEAPPPAPESPPDEPRASLSQGQGGTLYLEPEPSEEVEVEVEPAPEPAPEEEAPVEVEVVPEPVEAVESVGDPATSPSPHAEEPEPEVQEHPLHKQLLEAVTRIAESYAEAELPPAVSHLMGLIQTRSYDQVRAEITSIWSDLLKYHQKKGLRIQHQVTTTFNTINSLVKKM